MVAPTAVKRRRPPARKQRYALLFPLGLALLIGIMAWWWIPQENVMLYAAGAPHHWAAKSELNAYARTLGNASLGYRYVSLPSISTSMQFAAIAGEDIGYLWHGPVDLSAIQEALQERMQGKKLRGASTISQQVAKNLFLSLDRSLWRKVDEVRIAWALEKKLGKRRVLELYLNIAETGDGFVGVELAAQNYYGLSASDLTDEQAAGVAASIPSPRANNPRTATKIWKLRRDAILQRMENTPQIRRQLEKW